MNVHAPHEPQSRGAPPEEAPPSPAEWLVAAIGLVLVLASLASLAWHGLQERADPPRPQIRLLDVQAQEGRFLVRVRVHNRGAATAAKLRVTAQLRRGGQLVEEREVEFDYLPGESSREAGLFFEQDPRGFEMVVAPASFQQP